ncbi:unnamed protein product, partial [Choristocarpus tenellus]
MLHKKRVCIQVSVPDLLEHLHLRSCSLVVLSRGGLINNITSIHDTETLLNGSRISSNRSRNRSVLGEGPTNDRLGDLAMDNQQNTSMLGQNTRTPPLSLVDGFVATGARTVITRLWCDNQSSVVDTVLLLQFYQKLREATLDGEKRPVSVALRASQLWLKDATLSDILSLLQDTKRLGIEVVEGMQEALSTLFREVGSSGAATRKPFSSPYFWASFQV